MVSHRLGASGPGSELLRAEMESASSGNIERRGLHQNHHLGTSPVLRITEDWSAFVRLCFGD